jgi:elongation factor Ts
MTEITAGLVKSLREATGAGMMDCKKALVEVNGDFEGAVDWLRQKGLGAAAKKASRVACEGLVAFAVNGKQAALIELNSETDFVARNEQFQTLVKTSAELALKTNGDVGQLKAASYPGTGRTLEEEIAHHVAIIGENMNLRRASMLEVTNGVVASYMHNTVVPTLGKIGVLVALESSGDTVKLSELGRKIAMHIAASKPESLTVSDLDPALIERERNIFIEQAKASGKPDSIIEKMVEGRLRKYYEEAVLLEQVFVMDGKTKIADLLVAEAKDIGEAITIKSYVRFGLGEGIEQEETDFAKDVAAMANKG